MVVPQRKLSEQYLTGVRSEPYDVDWSVSFISSMYIVYIHTYHIYMLCMYVYIYIQVNMNTCQCKYGHTVQIYLSICICLNCLSEIAANVHFSMCNTLLHLPAWGPSAILQWGAFGTYFCTAIILMMFSVSWPRLDDIMTETVLTVKDYKGTLW